MVTVMKIAVAGAGIGGLTVAALLGQDGHDVAVFDQFDSPRPVGSGLVIQPVGQAVLAEIDALDEALKLGNSVYHMLGFEAEAGRPVLNVRYHNDGGPRFGLAIHRASLFTAIWNSPTAGHCTASKRRRAKRKGRHSDPARWHRTRAL